MLTLRELGCCSTLERSLLTGTPGLRLCSFPLGASSPLASSGFSWAFLRTFYSELLLSLFQFDGDSAYVGMSDGNPELLSTSQVGAPSFLHWVGCLALGWLEPSCPGVGGVQSGGTAHHCPLSE